MGFEGLKPTDCFGIDGSSSFFPLFGSWVSEDGIHASFSTLAFQEIALKGTQPKPFQIHDQLLCSSFALQHIVRYFAKCSVRFFLGIKTESIRKVSNFFIFETVPCTRIISIISHSFLHFSRDIHVISYL